MVKLLLIDDSAFERTAVKGLLKKIGYDDFVEAETAEGGINKYKEGGVDLVLLDYRLPDMSGADCIVELKKIDLKVKVVMVSMIREPGQVEKSLQAGAIDYVAKPVTQERLKAGVDKALK